MGRLDRTAGRHADAFADPRMREVHLAAAGSADVDAEASRHRFRILAICGWRASPPVYWRLPRRGHGFPGSHGPPEQRVNCRWLTRRYRRPRSSLEKIPQIGYLARLMLSASAPGGMKIARPNPTAVVRPAAMDRTERTRPALPARRMPPPHEMAKRTQRHASPWRRREPNEPNSARRSLPKDTERTRRPNVASPVEK